ncbi:MAG TPA: PEP-CTERM-box response regulator transcription factor [Vicinamibacteria bacterium]|nr:PEP-CTERM-box response regulator transcription factor [Vicinamibacteria bacterium]
MTKPTLLIVDDDEDLRTQMKWALADECEIVLAGDRTEALERSLEARPAVVTLDLGLPPKAAGVEEGFATLQALLRAEPSTKVVVITGRDEREHALAAVSQGAYDFFQKPAPIDELKVVLRRAFQLHTLERENRDLQRRLGGNGLEDLIGTSEVMQQVFSAVRKLAVHEAAVLVLGESGTGKELVARAIHRLSARAEGPFVAINCGAIPENLLESELFGHEKGSFTGAHIQRKGRIELAHGGTLFLDEIGELPLALQVKVLRFLQEHKIQRVGGRQDLTVDVRVICATNSDLKTAMAEGRFRDDLYYRVAVVSLALPPLRARGEDIFLLARAFLERESGPARKKITGFSSEALNALEVHVWPGNVRELENRVRRAVVMADGPLATPADLELEDTSPDGGPGRGLKSLRETLEREAIRKALARNRDNVSQAAADLGISRPTLYGLMDKLKISRDPQG